MKSVVVIYWHHPRRPLSFTPFLPGKIVKPVETMNDNCVFIPIMVSFDVGNLDPAFIHGIGDFDYGLRAQKLGIRVIVSSGYFGICKRDLIVDKKLPFPLRIKQMFSTKGLPPRDWSIFARRYSGQLWPIYWLSPYLHRILFL